MTDTLDLIQLAVFGFFNGLGLTLGTKLASLLFEKAVEKRIKAKEKLEALKR